MGEERRRESRGEVKTGSLGDEGGALSKPLLIDTVMVQIILLWIITGIDYKIRLHVYTHRCDVEASLNFWNRTRTPIVCAKLVSWGFDKLSRKIQLEPENKI